jgi:hypothetical protein
MVGNYTPICSFLVVHAYILHVTHSTLVLQLVDIVIQVVLLDHLCNLSISLPCICGRVELCLSVLDSYYVTTHPFDARWVGTSSP